MKQGGGKGKGDSYERKICNLLSNWYYGELRLIVRSRGSGGWPDKGKIGSDWVMPKEIIDKRNLPLFPAVGDCKFRKTISDIRNLLHEDEHALFKYWRKLETDLENSPYRDFQRWLIFTNNQWQDYLMMSGGAFDEWILALRIADVKYEDDEVNPINSFSFFPRTESPGAIEEELIIVLLNDFLKVFAPTTYVGALGRAKEISAEPDIDISDIEINISEVVKTLTGWVQGRLEADNV